MAPLRNASNRNSIVAGVRTTFVAANRGDNERGVLRPFLSKLLRNGFSLSVRPDLVDHHWLNACALSNYIFRPLTLRNEVSYAPIRSHFKVRLPPVSASAGRVKSSVPPPPPLLCVCVF